MIESLVKTLLFAAPFVVIGIFWWMSARERRRANDPSAKSFLQRNGGAISAYLIGAVGFWIVLMIVLPQLVMVDFSFHPQLPFKDYGGPNDHYTIASYKYFLFGSTTDTSAWNVTHLKAFVLTIFASIFVTVLNFCLCYPLAYYMAQAARAEKLRLLMLMLIVPFWVNEILRAFAFTIIFGSGGVINDILLAFGLIDAPYDFIGADVAMYAGLSYAYLLMMVFPLYNAIESLDHNQIEAARDLGAPWWHIHLFIVMPYAKPGIASGCTMVFMLSAGALAAPLILGGPNSLWFTPILYDRFYQAFNWPQGSAYALILLLTCVIFVMLVLKVFKVNLGEITR